MILQVRVDLVPLADWRNDVQSNELVTHLAEVLIRSIQLSVLLRCTLWNLVLSALSCHSGLHGHHDMVVLVGLYVCANREAEWLTTHSGTDHLN